MRSGRVTIVRILGFQKLRWSYGGKLCRLSKYRICLLPLHLVTLRSGTKHSSIINYAYVSSRIKRRWILQPRWAYAISSNNIFCTMTNNGTKFHKKKNNFILEYSLMNLNWVFNFVTNYDKSKQTSVDYFFFSCSFEVATLLGNEYPLLWKTCPSDANFCRIFVKFLQSSVNNKLYSVH